LLKHDPGQLQEEEEEGEGIAGWIQEGILEG